MPNADDLPDMAIDFHIVPTPIDKLVVQGAGEGAPAMRWGRRLSTCR